MFSKYMLDAWSIVFWGKVPVVHILVKDRKQPFSPNVKKQRVAFSVLVY